MLVMVTVAIGGLAILLGAGFVAAIVIGAATAVGGAVVVAVVTRGHSG